jgi:hypothetical protein
MRKKRPHPKHCRHCQMVEEYRIERARQEIQFENGGFRDPNFRRNMITFKKWIIAYRYEPTQAQWEALQAA